MVALWDDWIRPESSHPRLPAAFFPLFLAVLGLRCCAGFSLVAGTGGYSQLRFRLLIAEASLVSEHRLQGLRHLGSVLAAPRP